MIPKRRRKEPMGLREEQQIRSPGHLAWVRGHECATKTGDCNGRIEAAHVRIGTDGGTSLKPGDNWTIPLCSDHHREQHQIGETEFGMRHGINMKKLAEVIWRRSPHRLKHQRKA